MKLVIVPRYSELFDEPLQDPKGLLAGISSEIILGLMAMIQAELQLSSDSELTQSKILKLFLQRQKIEVTNTIISKIVESQVAKDDGDFSLFSQHYVLDFIHHILCNFDILSVSDDTTPEQELNIFKAYLYFIEQRHDKDTEVFDENRHHEDDFFFKNTWPILSGQFEANRLVNPMAEMFRGLVFLNYLHFESPYKNYVEEFLKKRGHANAWHYILSISNAILHSWNHEKNKQNGFSNFSITSTKEYDPFLHTLAINPVEYRQAYSERHANYAGIKSKPLFYDGNSQCYYILNWNFFSNKLYEGLVFDFYAHSGIAECNSFKTFTDFKRHIGEFVTEGVLFRKTLGAALNRKHSKLLFDNKDKKGFPDAYFRQGNKIILFEIKDAYWPAVATDTSSYEKIKDAIDKKYNSQDKGTGQLIKQLKKLAERPFEASPTYKWNRNLTIYPVMIYSDYYFSMPGINQYLDLSFKEQLKRENLETTFKLVKPLIFMNLRFLINNLDILQHHGSDLISLFEEYYREQQKVSKKAKRGDDLNAYFDTYQNFEAALNKRIPLINATRTEWVKCVVDALDLTTGLPTTST